MADTGEVLNWMGVGCNEYRKLGVIPQHDFKEPLDILPAVHAHQACCGSKHTVLLTGKHSTVQCLVDTCNGALRKWIIIHRW